MAAGHGGNLRQLAIHAGRDPERIVDFSASINPLGPPERLRAALARSIEHLVHYPDPDCSELVELLAQRHGVARQQVIVGNGSTEILFALARAVAFDRAVIPVPAYIDYAAAVQAAGREVALLALQEDTGFALDWQTLEASLRGGELVMLGQPNNPTGRAFDSDQFRDLAARHPSTTFVVDEAFADFVDGYRSLAEPVCPNAIVVRSLTKFYAIPGLRVGYAIAQAATAQQIRRQIPPWSVGVLAQQAAVAVLSDDDYAGQSVAVVDDERRRLTDGLTSIPGLHVYPSFTNFLLVRLDRSDVTVPALADRLLQDGIAIRTFGPGQYLDERFFRVAVRLAAENAKLCEAVATVLQPARRPRRKPARAKALMIQGTSSNAGKSVLTAALCRILFQEGVRVAPFKSQNMSLNSFVTRDGGEMGRAQVVQAQACRLEPDVRMNPVLLKPNSDTGCQVIVNGRPVGNMRVGEYVRYKPEAFAAAKQCYDALAAEFDAIVLEGAGSPGEVNLKRHDIVNMRMAQYAEAPVLVAGDIDRGGVFASFVGTMEVLEPWERRLVAGWIVNRFRGDAGLLGPALEYTLRHTGRPVLGVVPYLPELGLPEEDSVEFKSRALDPQADARACVEIAVVDLPHIANFTDFDAFRVESDVRLRIVRAADELDTPDAVILPGSKNTLADLGYLRRSGLAARLAVLAQQGKTEIIGICAGLQMLGRGIADPLAIESTLESSQGLALLNADTVMAAGKTLRRGTARHGASGLEVTGYEIHHGQTSSDRCEPWLTGSDGRIVGIASVDRRVWGTYLHGVFDADAFRRWFIDHLRMRRGLSPVGQVIARYDIQPALDRLAQVVRDHVRIDEVFRIMGL
ncbi:MAG: cobyric acid synthase [Planctomycetaceae bacterium]|nr:MAG: cobyric acid synthase [Planctomycetaceae bacterium]